MLTGAAVWVGGSGKPGRTGRRGPFGACATSP